MDSRIQKGRGVGFRRDRGVGFRRAAGSDSEGIAGSDSEGGHVVGFSGDMGITAGLWR